MIASPDLQCCYLYHRDTEGKTPLYYALFQSTADGESGEGTAELLVGSGAAVDVVR